MLEDAGRQLPRETPRRELSASRPLVLVYDASDATRKGVAEHAALETHRVISLVHLPGKHWLGARVRDGVAPHWGGWVRDDIWFETGAPKARAGESR